MSAVRNRDSVAELAIRKRLWRSGLRYRLHTDLPGRPDIVFPKQCLAIFVDGDFWHGNAWRVRGLPNFDAQFSNRADWWSAKIRRNMERDRIVSRRLAELGWTVLRFWESEILKDPNAVAKDIAYRVKGSDEWSMNAIEPTPIERRRLASIRKALPRATSS